MGSSGREKWVVGQMQITNFDDSTVFSYFNSFFRVWRAMGKDDVDERERLIWARTGARYASVNQNWDHHVHCCARCARLVFSILSLSLELKYCTGRTGVVLCFCRRNLNARVFYLRRCGRGASRTYRYSSCELYSLPDHPYYPLHPN